MFILIISGNFHLFGILLPFFVFIIYDFHRRNIISLGLFVDIFI